MPASTTPRLSLAFQSLQGWVKIIAIQALIAITPIKLEAMARQFTPFDETESIEQTLAWTKAAKRIIAALLCGLILVGVWALLNWVLNRIQENYYRMLFLIVENSDQGN